VLSFVVVTDTVATIARVLTALQAQTIREQIELVAVCQDEQALGLTPAHVEGLGAVRVLEVDSILPLHDASAAGVRASSGEIVVIGETHAFPDPDAFDLVVRAFADETIGAVAPGLRNANPGPASWGSLMVTYGTALGGEAHDTETISTHNAAVRRRLLVDLGDDLAFRLTLGGGLGETLRRQGHRLRYEPSVVYAHLNVTRLEACLRDRFYASRIYASGRSRGWGAGRRALYLAGAPLLPAVLAWKVTHSSGWTQHRHELGRSVWPSVAVSVVGMAAGEAAAYARGVGRAHELVAEYEVHRERHI
jgi:hypothetical protein